MTLLTVFDDALKLLGVEKPDFSPVYIRDRVLHDINAVLQTIGTSDNDYFKKEAASIDLAAGTAGYPLPDDTLHVIFPVRLADGTMLRELKRRSELEMFGQLYLGQTAVAVAQDKPMAVFIEGSKRAGGGSNVQATAWFAPTPDAAYTATLDITRQPPIFTVDDLGDSSKTVPIPDQFTESIFLPMVRWSVRTSHYFNRPEMLPDLAAQYDAALQALGLTDPQRNQEKRLDRMARADAYRDAARTRQQPPPQ